MFQKVGVLRTFAQSKPWYVCQVLPLPNAFAKKVESMISSFLFRGKPERLMLEELFNPTSKGGLGILDVRNKANALFMKQLSRMLTRKEEGSYHHLCYWLGSHLQQRLPDMLDRGPVLQRPPPPFHQHTLTLPQEGFQWFGVDPSKLRDITAKKLYKEYTSDISEPKIPSSCKSTFLVMCGPACHTPSCHQELGSQCSTQSTARSDMEQGKTTPAGASCPRTIPLQPPSVKCRTSILFLLDGEGILDLHQVPGVPAPTRPAGNWGQQPGEVLVPKWEPGRRGGVAASHTTGDGAGGVPG